MLQITCVCVCVCVHVCMCVCVHVCMCVCVCVCVEGGLKSLGKYPAIISIINCFMCFQNFLH